MRRTIHTSIDDRARSAVTVLAVAVLAVTVGLTAATAPASADPDDPTITNATVTTTGETVTITVSVTNTTEIDLQGVPESWNITSRHDDYGRYLDQRSSHDRLVWLWSTPVSATVSVTVRTPEAISVSDLSLRAVPYSGTTDGESTVIGHSVTTTPGETTAGTPDVTTTGRTDSTTTATLTHTSIGSTTTTNAGPTGSGGGPGMSVTTALAATLLLAGLTARRRELT